MSEFYDVLRQALQEAIAVERGEMEFRHRTYVLTEEGWMDNKQVDTNND